MRIEVCGGIASGKTTFVKAIGTYLTRFSTVYEDFSSNTFLDDFYKNVSRYAYETEISFLLQHMHQIKCAMVDARDLMCDFSIEQDYAYAINNLDSISKPSFDEIYKETIRQISLPDLVIFLQCPSSILLERIRMRGRENEMNIDLMYLDSTLQTLNNHISSIRSSIVTIDSHQYDFRKADDIEIVYTEILKKYLEN